MNGDAVNGCGVVYQFLDAGFGDSLLFADEGSGYLKCVSNVGGFFVLAALGPDPILFR